MSGAIKLSIVKNDVAEHGLLLEAGINDSQFSTPIRHGHIYFAQLLSEDKAAIDTLPDPGSRM